MTISAVNLNFSPVNGKKYNNISFGKYVNNGNNSGDSFQISIDSKSEELNKIRKFGELISCKGPKLKPDEANIAVLNGYEGKTLEDYVFAIHQGFDIEEAETYAEYELSGFYSDYENEFEKNPYSKHRPTDILFFMKKHELTQDEAFYPIGMEMDEETIRKYKVFLTVLKHNNTEDKEHLKLIADEAVKSVNNDREAKRKQIVNNLTISKHIPCDMAELISKSPVLLSRVDVIKGMFPINQNNGKYPIKPYKPISRKNFIKILSNETIINDFDRFVGLISVDKRTNEPVSKKMRALNLNEAYHFIAKKLPNSDINTFIFYCNCGIKPSEAAEMLASEKE